MTERTTDTGPIPTGPNDYAWFAMGLALAPLFMIAFAWWLWSVTGHDARSGGTSPILSGRGGGFWALGVLLALSGTYFGIRGHNLAVRGFATNGRMARTCALLGVVVALAVVASAFTLGTVAAET